MFYRRSGSMGWRVWSIYFFWLIISKLRYKWEYGICNDVSKVRYCYVRRSRENKDRFLIFIERSKRE